MRILFLGAAGQMAGPAIEVLAESPAVNELILADRPSVPLRPVTLANGNPARQLAVDVTQTDALMRALKHADLVVNTTGPYYLLGEPVVKAAIESGCHYIDICDDWEPTLALMALDEQARRNGVTVLLGAGASPGLTNLLAVEAAKRLQRVDRLITGWSLADDSELADIELQRMQSATGTSAALVHWMQQISGRIKVWRRGQLSTVKPLQRISINYPGIGQCTGRSVGHPEAVTLPHYYPSLQESINVMVDAEQITPILQLLSWSINRGLMTLNTAANWIQRLARWEARRQALRRQSPAKPKPQALPELFALAQGQLDNRSATIACSLKRLPKGGMAELTGVPLGLFAALLAEGEITRKGVISPEASGVGSLVFERLGSLPGEDLLDVRQLYS